MRINSNDYKRVINEIKEVNDSPLKELIIDNGKPLCDKFVKDAVFTGLTNWSILKMIMDNEFSHEELFEKGLGF